MLFSYQALVLAALALKGVAASPAHRHAHEHAHKRNLADLIGKRGFWDNKEIYKDVDWSTVSYTNGFGQAPTPPPSPPVQAASPKEEQPKPAEPAPKAPSEPSTPHHSGGSGKCIDISVVWSKGDTSKVNSFGTTAATFGGKPWTDKSSSSMKAKRATAAQDGAMGNTGGSQYGSNMVPLSDCNDKSHKYTIQFTNSYPDGKDMSVALWNKNGEDGQPQSGAFNDAFFFFDLPAGKSAAFAFEPESMIAFSELSEQCPRDPQGAGGIKCIWGEANFEPPPTHGAWESAWDISMDYDHSAKGELVISDGRPEGTSSKASCGFTDAAQLSAGAGTGQTCDPQIDRYKPVYLTANFGAT